MSESTGKEIEKDIEHSVRSEYKSTRAGLSLGGLSLRQLLPLVWNSSNEDDILNRAAELAYYFLFALFPALIFLSAMFGLVASAQAQSKLELMLYLEKVIPPAAFGLVHSAFVSTTKASDGKTLVLGALFALWSATYGMSSAQNILNVIYRIKETRAFWRSKLIAMGLTLVIFVLVFISMMLLILGDYLTKLLINHLIIGDGAIILWKIVQLCASLFLLSLVFSITYHWAPDRSGHKWRWISPGALVGIIGWITVSIGFRLYLRFFNSYAITYGSFGAVIILLTWFYVSGLMLLLGAEINASIDRAGLQG